MSDNHVTLGFGHYEAFIKALKTAGISFRQVPKKKLRVLGELCVLGYACEDKCYGMCEKHPCKCCGRTCEHIQHLRVAHFNTANGKAMVVEEWLAVEDHDCDGMSSVSIAVYPKGKKPRLVTEVLEAR